MEINCLLTLLFNYENITNILSFRTHKKIECYLHFYSIDLKQYTLSIKHSILDLDFSYQPCPFWSLGMLFVLLIGPSSKILEKVQ